MRVHAKSESTQPRSETSLVTLYKSEIGTFISVGEGIPRILRQEAADRVQGRRGGAQVCAFGIKLINHRQDTFRHSNWKYYSTSEF